MIEGSNPSPPANMFLRLRGYSSVGRAVALQASGRRFDPVYLHHYFHDEACLYHAKTGIAEDV